MHSTENSKQIFPEMKMRGLAPNSTFTYLGEINIFPPTVLFGNSFTLKAQKKIDHKD